MSIAIYPGSSGLFGRSYKGTPLQGSTQVSELLLNDFRIAAVPGAPFGVDNNIRLSFATSRELLRKGLERFREFTQAVS
jgi:aspartate aminotransferase